MITFIYDVEQAGFLLYRRDARPWGERGASVARKKRGDGAFGVFTRDCYAPI